MPVPGAVEAVQTFDPQVIIAQFAPVTREVIENAKSWKLSAACAAALKILMWTLPASASSCFK